MAAKNFDCLLGWFAANFGMVRTKAICSLEAATDFGENIALVVSTGGDRRRIFHAIHLVF